MKNKEVTPEVSHYLAGFVNRTCPGEVDGKHPAEDESDCRYELCETYYHCNNCPLNKDFDVAT